MNLFPLVAFDRIRDDEADACLSVWGHWLGPCNRPFGIQSWGLTLQGELVAVAVSASTVGDVCAGRPRETLCELARLCAHPMHRDLTRVALRLWRKVAADAWSAKYWPVGAYASYANSNRHTGDIYRFDGWKQWGKTRGGTVGKNAGWAKPGTKIEPKTIWGWDLEVVL